MKKIEQNYTSFPGGFYFEKYLEKELCIKLRNELQKANWIPALVARYEGSEYRGIEHNPKLSTAIVTREFKFQSDTLSIERIHTELKILIGKRFKIIPDKFSDYGVSQYPVGSKLSAHTDTGVYSTKRLITCILYLSSASKGGELVFPEVDFEIFVQTGMLVCFYSELKHEVKEIIEGERIAIVLFAEGK